MTAGNIKAVVYDERKSKYKARESPNCVVNQPEKKKYGREVLTCSLIVFSGISTCECHGRVDQSRTLALNVWS